MKMFTRVSSILATIGMLSSMANVALALTPKEAAAKAFSTADCSVTGNVPLSLLNGDMVNEDGYIILKTQENRKIFISAGEDGSKGTLFVGLKRRLGADVSGLYSYAVGPTGTNPSMMHKVFTSYAKTSGKEPSLVDLNIQAAVESEVISIYCFEKK